ncbi:MAG TPA: hypothetical protein VN282_26670 [Pyrinomonadaceae bacterium]|nr:hypothetical protein [Pyrinomonadaceae bacterium]
MRSLLSLCACVLWLTACARSGSGPKGSEPKFDKVVSIKVTKDGRVFYNKRPVSVDELGDELKKLDNKDTAVCYYREAGAEEPPPVYKEVIRKVTDARLAVKLSEEECP